ncbi:MAG: type IV secretion system DNA-binding domain-containing protein [Bacillota bacterium]
MKIKLNLQVDSQAVETAKRLGLLSIVILLVCFCLLVMDVRILGPRAARSVAGDARLWAILTPSPAKKAELQEKAAVLDRAADWYAQHPVRTTWAWLTQKDSALTFPEVRRKWLLYNLIIILLLADGIALTWYLRRRRLPPLKTTPFGGKGVLPFRERLNKTDPSAPERPRRALKRIARMSHPPEGVLIGVDDRGRPVLITVREINHHVFICGTTGGGKSTTILNFIEFAARHGWVVIVVNGKYDPTQPSFRTVMEYWAKKHGRRLRVFSMVEESARYNPLAQGGFSSLKDKLMALTDWSEPHYRAQVAAFLQILIRVLRETGRQVDLPTVAGLIDLQAVAALARRIPDEKTRREILDDLDQLSQKDIRGAFARLAEITASEIGHLFVSDPEGIDLVAAIQNNEMVLFDLDPLAFPDFARLLGRLIVLDLKAAASQYRRSGSPKKVMVVLDEFNVFVSDAVVDLFSKTRSAGFGVVAGTQSAKADIAREGGPELVEQIVENASTFIIHRQNAPGNAAYLADLVGTKETYELTYQVGVQPLLGEGRTGLGSARQVRQYLVHPDAVKALRTGEAFLVRKGSIESEVTHLWVRRSADIG